MAKELKFKVYLEEDRDAEILLNALRLIGKTYKVVETRCKDRSPVRSYDNFHIGVAELEAFRITPLVLVVAVYVALPLVPFLYFLVCSII